LSLDIAWLIGCSGLVFLMQPGFMCLESGLTRSKNSTNVAIKNLTDFAISVLVFWLFGFALMFGATQAGWIGASYFAPELADSARLAAFFLFQAMFCGTATTIVSGAVSERVRYSLYLCVCLMISGLIYPLFGHWAWNGIEDLGGSSAVGGWLQALGFADFAGSTVVHSVGGWVALAALLVIGPRTGRYGPDGRANDIHGSDLPLSVLGCMLLWLGWMGFNGGSTLSFDEQIPRIVVQTILAGTTGLLSAGLIGWYYNKIPRVETLINGSLAGLVSITAGCNVMSTPSAAVVGAIGGAVMLLATRLMNYWHIDDGVDAVAIHGVCGLWGTLAVALVGQLDILDTGLSRYAQLGVQLLGVSVAFVWAFGVSYVLLSLLNRIAPLRVTAEAEELGLNVSEHGAKTEVYDLFQVMDQQAQTQDFSLRVPEEPFTEVGKIARRYNQVMATVESYAGRLENFNRQLEDKVAARTSELAAANQELKRMDAVKDQFLANTSHELRTPLNGMIGLAESMLDGVGGTVSSEQRENLTLIAQSGRRLANLVNDILDFSQLRYQQLPLQLGPVRLRTMADLIITLSQASLPSKKKLEIVNGIPLDLPLVYADANRLQQILYNLIGNAIKFTPQGLVTLMAIALDPPSPVANAVGQVQVTIADTGIGIAPEKLPYIFNSFEQGDGSTARRYGGTGLGLAITKQLLELHGGNLSVDSVLGEGSQFRFTLPLCPENWQELANPVPLPVATELSQWQVQPLLSPLEPQPGPVAPRSQPFEPTPAPAAGLTASTAASTLRNGEQRFRILLVDDEPVNLKVLVEHLSLAHYELLQASSGPEALAILERSQSPDSQPSDRLDLVLLDVMMPGIDGFETCRRLKASPETQDIPIIFMTALSEPVSKAKGFSLGAVDYITKPFEAEEVLARVKTHLRLNQLTAQLEQEVENRTAELTSALADLQQAQTQLVQSERMSLVGELSAGVAYEISNPVNYIRGNLRHLTTYCTQLLQFAEAVYPHLPSSEKCPETDSLSQLSDTMLDLDLPFVREDLPKILKSFDRGTDKIQQLISDLRTFATADKAGRKKVNSHELIDSCLMLLGHKLQAKKHRAPILIRKDYQPTSQIECYPAALNQAVIGILLTYINQLERSQDQLDDAEDALTQSTASHSTASQNTTPQNTALQSTAPQISVQTTCRAEGWTTIVLSIGIEGVFSDDVFLNNPALPPNLSDKSTQTSLLSHPDDVNLILAHDIVCNQHKGRCLQCSELGNTTVTIEIPTVLPVTVPPEAVLPKAVLSATE